ncbi:4'-phosphopantetheinyl transferase family protein [Aestuariispira insulae]|uniref:4'-phosphopantetheinyl transferase superfamily protein n=1 Tax=Aestuariispira insulae TaxID=1461337 RepID=A0A3D9H8J9_9PROT|nr:4'-phosphopantetheinyl transferase superfamily protein [Aestuariispira insulae]RED45824.1 4'-phosphopantetheinyl transferase superfamily protein [Aestuariispira insulae]
MTGSIGQWYLQLRSRWQALQARPEIALLAVVPIEAPGPPEGQLLPEEQDRRDRYRFDRDRNAYAHGRLLVRWLLMGDGETRSFSVGENGKPFLPGSAEFNISHGAGLVAVLFSRAGAVGVDVEALAKMKRHENLHDMVCHPNERQWIEEQGADKGREAFLKCWTRKEALLKATGQGILNDLPSLNTCLDDDMPDTHLASGHRLRDMALPFDGVGCAIAIPEGVRDVELACLDLD